MSSSTPSVKRGKNFTSFEKTLVVDIVERQQHIIEGRGNSSSIVEKKNNAWKKICEDYNSNDRVTKRGVDSLKLLWKNIKDKAKKEDSRYKKELIKTGGGGPIAPIEGLNERVIGIISEELKGVPNPYDEDAVFSQADHPNLAGRSYHYQRFSLSIDKHS